MNYCGLVESYIINNIITCSHRDKCEKVKVKLFLIRFEHYILIPIPVKNKANEFGRYNQSVSKDNGENMMKLKLNLTRLNLKRNPSQFSYQSAIPIQRTGTSSAKQKGFYTRR